MSNFKEYAKYYDLIYADKDYEGEAEMVWKWAKEPNTILDLGIGTGQHAKWWSERTSVVWGIDNSDEMIKRALKTAPLAIIKNGKIEDEKWKNQIFCCVAAMFNVMGYLSSLNFNIPVKKGGYFIFDCWDYRKVLKTPPTVRRKVFGKYTRISIPTMLFPWEVMVEFFILKKDKCVAYERHMVCTYKKSYLVMKLKEKGFKLIATRQGQGWVRWYKFQKT